MSDEEFKMFVCTSFGELKTDVANVKTDVASVKALQTAQNGRVFTLADRVQAIDIHLAERANTCPLLKPIIEDVAALKTTQSRNEEAGKVNHTWFAVLCSAAGAGLMLLGNVILHHFKLL